ncbi:MAG TPA: hypothetical protein VFC25_13510 [Verrucomicrobiae bacterium]|nr:hypothetical protein [Verrucomicrobiae bacterium]
MIQSQMNYDLEYNDPFERRRTNRAVFIMVAMVFAAIALNDGIQSFMKRTQGSAIARSMTPGKAATTMPRLDLHDDSTLEVH